MELVVSSPPSPEEPIPVEHKLAGRPACCNFERNWCPESARIEFRIPEAGNQSFPIPVRIPWAEWSRVQCFGSQTDQTRDASSPSQLDALDPG